MSKLAQERTDFINQLHDVFIQRTGRGAFAFISISDAMTLFDVYLISSDEAGFFIGRYVRSF